MPPRSQARARCSTDRRWIDQWSKRAGIPAPAHDKRGRCEGADFISRLVVAVVALAIPNSGTSRDRAILEKVKIFFKRAGHSVTALCRSASPSDRSDAKIDRWVSSFSQETLWKTLWKTSRCPIPSPSAASGAFCHPHRTSPAFPPAGIGDKFSNKFSTWQLRMWISCWHPADSP